MKTILLSGAISMIVALFGTRPTISVLRKRKLGQAMRLDGAQATPALSKSGTPSMGGIAYTELELLIAGLVSAPACVGIEITVFDPDYDPDGVHARDVADTLVAGLAPLVHSGSVGNVDVTSVANPVPDAPSAAPDGPTAVDGPAIASDAAPEAPSPAREAPVVMPAQRVADNESAVDAG